jgi:hypothetical protein
MKTMTRSVYAIWATAMLAIGATGCSSDDDDEVIIVPAAIGTLTTEWSIDGSFVASNCRIYGAFDYELVVYDLDNFIVTEQQTPCEQFVLSVDLPVGIYSADATLVDSEDFSVSLTQVLDDLEIIDGTELVVSIDFPATSMLTSRDEQAAAPPPN